MRSLLVLLIFWMSLHTFISAQQTDIQKLIDTEHSFAQAAAVNGTKSAFLEYLADDGLVFTPDAANGKAFWTARSASPSLLSWAPNFADISSNGVLGYTTGNWEYRAKGKGDTPSAFGDFITLWLRQSDGQYRFVVDIGVAHDKPGTYSTQWKTVTSGFEKNGSDLKREAVTEFFEMANKQGLVKAYKSFAADDLRSYREGSMPILTKRNTLAILDKDKASFAFGKRSTTFTAGDISYNLNTYSRSIKGKEIEKGNFLQIWKYIDGHWKMVLDIFKPIQ
jgi:hypothetical protein